MEQRQLQLRSIDGSDTTTVLVSWQQRGELYKVTVRALDSVLYEAIAEVDYETAISQIRRQLERDGKLLLCNRFRRNAVITSISRQMSAGLGCYLVRLHRAVRHTQIVHVFDPAPADEVVTEREAEEFIYRWRTTFNAWDGLRTKILIHWDKYQERRTTWS